jgi:hypothetical protein
MMQLPQGPIVFMREAWPHFLMFLLISNLFFSFVHENVFQFLTSVFDPRPILIPSLASFASFSGVID